MVCSELILGNGGYLHFREYHLEETEEIDGIANFMYPKRIENEIVKAIGEK